MTVYDQSEELKENLPTYLQQEYEAGGYEVIVVDESSTDSTPDVLKLFKNEYPQLYSTFLPKPDRKKFRRKLAFNIGAKAAKNEWLIITEIRNKPANTDILKAINEVLEDDADITLGYVTKKGIRLQPFSSINEVKDHVKRIERKLTIVREGKALNYFWGRYSFIIVKKEKLYDLLNFYEQKIPHRTLPGMRMKIIWKNMLRRSSTTLLVSS